ncbi:MAG: transporter [Campylobacterota bacterium]|nr:transporter [Campylobacterota bacterium]
MILPRKRITLLLGASLIISASSMADEGGVSFWLPGQYGSFAASQSEPGWSMASIYYHNSSDSEKTFTRGLNLTAGLDVSQDLLLLSPTYVFNDPLWGGQASVSLTALYGRVGVNVSAVLSDSQGHTISGSQSDTLTAFGDLYPAASLKWNEGVHSYMVYTMFGVPVGSYDKNELSNIGSNHWAADFGGGYTYLDMKTGYEFSLTAGLTYNFENRDTNYQNGIDGHIDWGASRFLSETLNVGLAGYFFYQLSGDSGEGAILGDFKSRVNAVGPQLTYFFPVGKTQGVLSVKSYWEFGAEHRTEGWNSWVIVSIPL